MFKNSRNYLLYVEEIYTYERKRQRGEGATLKHYISRGYMDIFTLFLFALLNLHYSAAFFFVFREGEEIINFVFFNAFLLCCVFFPSRFSFSGLSFAASSLAAVNGKIRTTLTLAVIFSILTLLFFFQLILLSGALAW